MEAPLELLVEGVPLAVTMRTPGDDMDLAAGFLVSEGAVRQAEDVTSMRYCGGRDDQGLQTYNQLDLTLAVPAPAPRAFGTTSACGVCGSASIESIRSRSPYDLHRDVLPISPDLLYSLPHRLREAQRLFATTGGLHAAGPFDAHGELLSLREDVERHNAVDKVIG